MILRLLSDWLHYWKNRILKHIAFSVDKNDSPAAMKKHYQPAALKNINF